MCVYTEIHKRFGRTRTLKIYLSIYYQYKKKMKGKKIKKQQWIMVAFKQHKTKWDNQSKET